MTRKNVLQFLFDENLKKNANLSTTDALAFDDLGDFIEEREKIQRLVEERTQTELKVDYSDFANHVFFDSAESKLQIALDRTLNKYPFNGSLEEKDAFHLTGSGYENYVFEQWPRDVSYLELNGSDQYISVADTANKLWMGTSSFYVSTWTRPCITDENVIISNLTASGDNFCGYNLYFSGATDPHVKFDLFSGSEKISISAAYADYVSGFNNVAVMYDRPTQVLSLYINKTLQTASFISYGSFELVPGTFVVGSGSKHALPPDVSSSFDLFSGSIDEIRVLHTASHLYHVKNYSRPIDSENYVKLYYSCNEGKTSVASVDSVLVDYSPFGLHGSIANYTADLRVSGAVMLEDPGTPILYTLNPRVVAFSASMYLSATLYDQENNNNIFNMIAGGVMQEDDNANGLLRSFSLAMARYFDEMKLYIDQFVNLKVTNYEGTDETPDLFLPSLKRYFGWKVSEHFSEANPLEFLFGERVLASGSLGVPLNEIRNQFWKRTLNNLPLLIKSKGTRSNLDYLFNIFGLNKNTFSLKEYGHLPGTSIQDERINKQKTQYRLGIGTGSAGFSSSFIAVTADKLFGVTNFTDTAFTVETLTQLPFPSASYANVLLTGALWQMDNVAYIGSDDGFSASFRCFWTRESTLSEVGKIVLELTASAQERVMLTSSDVSIFNGDFTYIAAGQDDNRIPFISVRLLDVDSFKINSNAYGSARVTDQLSDSSMDLFVGANTSSLVWNDRQDSQGYFGEVRLWNRALSGSEIDDHAYNFQSIGIANPFTNTEYLMGHWAFNEGISTDSVGKINGIVDLSRNGATATGSQFPASMNPYTKFLHNYNYLSPSVDMKWTENKIRVRNKTELDISEVAKDTNEVSLEFNLVDALNEDIVKIFSTLDIFNNLIGQPIFKYRDEYSDLEGVRGLYFQRLGDSLNFSGFFDLFQWFDRKISDAIKQLLPARVNFIGGEQVVESHFLERPKYKYQYPVFRTPQEVPEASMVAAPGIASGSLHCNSLEGDALGTAGRSAFDQRAILGTKERKSIAISDGVPPLELVTTYSDGDERRDTSNHKFFRAKVAGDTKDDKLNPNSGLNNKNERARRILTNKDRDNE